MKLVKPAQFNRPVPLVIHTPFPRDAVAATLTIVILKDQSVYVLGNIAKEEIGLAIMQAGITRLQQHYASQRSPILGPDGLALAARTEIEQ